MPNIKAAVGGARQETGRFVLNRAAAAAVQTAKTRRLPVCILSRAVCPSRGDLLPTDRLRSESKRVDFSHLLLIYNQHLLAEVGQAPLTGEGVCFVSLGEPDGRRLAQEDRRCVSHGNIRPRCGSWNRSHLAPRANAARLFLFTAAPPAHRL